MKEKYFIIVDGFASGSAYPYTLKAYGLICLHVRSHKGFIPFFANTYDAKVYEKEFVFPNYEHYEAMLEDIRAYIGHYKVAGVLVGSTGSEGFVLTDKLSKDFALPGNDPETTQLRIDKHAMNQKLLEKGIPSLVQIKTARLEEMSEWANTRYPVLLKPFQDSGSRGIHICNNVEELTMGFNKNAALTNSIYGTDITETVHGQVLAQEYLTGTEYVVCTFSHEQEHYISSVWMTQKRLINDGSTKMRDYLKLLPPDCQEVIAIHAYMKQVLTSLGVSSGVCNSDVIIDPVRGPLLLEVNPRIPGGIDPIVYAQGLGVSYPNQIIEWSLYATDPQRRPPNPIFYTVMAHVYCVSVIAYNAGIVGEIDLSQIHALPSCLKTAFKYKSEDTVHKTMDLSTMAGMIFLSSKDEDQLQNDLRRIRDWEEHVFNPAIRPFIQKVKSSFDLKLFDHNQFEMLEGSTVGLRQTMDSNSISYFNGR